MRRTVKEALELQIVERQEAARKFEQARERENAVSAYTKALISTWENDGIPESLQVQVLMDSEYPVSQELLDEAKQRALVVINKIKEERVRRAEVRDFLKTTTAGWA